MGQSSIRIGKIGKAFGIKGFVHVYSFTEPPDAIFSYKNWAVNIKGNLKPLKIAETKESHNSFVLRFEGVNDRTEAETLKNLEISVPRSELPPLPQGEYYWADLMGLSVINESGLCLGQVDSLFATGANDVLVVKGKGEEKGDEAVEEYLIPYVSDYVLAIDLAKGQIRVHWEPEF